MEGVKEGELGWEAGEGECCLPGVGLREVDGEGEDAVEAIISQSSLWRNLAPQFPASEHSHDFLFWICAQHRLREPEHPRIAHRGFVSDLTVSPEIYLAAACQDDGVGAVFVGGDAVRGLVNDAVAVRSCRLEPPVADLKAEVTEGVCSRWLRCSLNRPS